MKESRTAKANGKADADSTGAEEAATKPAAGAPAPAAPPPAVPPAPAATGTAKVKPADEPTPAVTARASAATSNPAASGKASVPTSSSSDAGTRRPGVSSSLYAGTPVKGTAAVPLSSTTPPALSSTMVNPTTEPATAPTSGPSLGTGAVGAARVGDAVRTARATVAGATARGPRRARLHLKRIDPWSVMKFAFAVSLVLFIVAIVATSVLYLALDAMGVFESVNKALADMVGQDGVKITAKGVIGASVLLGAVNMVLFTALMTLGAFVYNVCADLVGGIELTLSEKD
ncbi:DUF3566 domain-containing protein [Luedemannella helvata]|uniref:DUF3566 domain-containing protein n=1 Tax=Luedemannella helvata TaxID=349315 RepID=UPI003CD07423